MIIPEYVTGPLIGGIIGCFTNYIAVKMLFLPRKEIRVFGHVLPFTPGAIPKGQARLAGSVGNAVATTLLTRKDIEDMLLSPEIEGEVTDVMMRHLTRGLRDEICRLSGTSDERYLEKRAAVSDLLSRKIVESVDVEKLMEVYGIEYLRNRIYSHKLGKLVSGDWIDSVAMGVARDLQEILNEKGDEYVRPIVEERIEHVEAKSTEEILMYVGMEEGHLKESLEEAYRSIASANLDRLLAHVDIAAVIADKIKAMDEKELERLILTVMKKELRTIISLGALIGFALGLLNCLW